MRQFKRGGRGRILIEAFEGRQLLSASVAAFGGTALVVTTPVLTGTTVRAEAGQPFTAVIGNIKGVGVIPAFYTLHGVINWGDGTATSLASFVTQPNGTVLIIGSHTYAAASAAVGHGITVTVTEVPPAGSEAPVRLVGMFQSVAQVFASPGGETLEETVGHAFTQNVGIFHSNLSSLTMTATIDWGDGTTSTGKILALPTAGLVGGFSVVGMHTYGAVGSYRIHVVVTSATSTAPIAVINSVAEVLPLLATAV